MHTEFTSPRAGCNHSNVSCPKVYHSENIYTQHMLNEKRHIHLAAPAKYRKHHEHYSKIFTAFNVTTTATEYTECR